MATMHKTLTRRALAFSVCAVSACQSSKARNERYSALKTALLAAQKEAELARDIGVETTIKSLISFCDSKRGSVLCNAPIRLSDGMLETEVRITQNDPSQPWAS